jgi:putative ABC transport system permease protein
VRAALGAERRRLFHMILGEGLMLAVIGVAVGLVGASFVTQLMTAALFGVTPLDTMSFLLAPLILVPDVTIACIVPAISALRADPLAVLRQ